MVWDEVFKQEQKTIPANATRDSEVEIANFPMQSDLEESIGLELRDGARTRGV